MIKQILSLKRKNIKEYVSADFIMPHLVPWELFEDELNFIDSFFLGNAKFEAVNLQFYAA